MWIHAVEVHSFVAAYRAYAGRLDDDDADRYVAEMVRVAEMVELPAGMSPRTMGELREYLRSVDGLQMTPAAREGMRTIFFPPMPLALRPLWAIPADRDARDPACASRGASTGCRGPPPARLPVRLNVFALDPGHERVPPAGTDHPAGAGPRRLPRPESPRVTARGAAAAPGRSLRAWPCSNRER